jgi:hypothetical protein
MHISVICILLIMSPAGRKTQVSVAVESFTQPKDGIRGRNECVDGGKECTESDSRLEKLGFGWSFLPSAEGLGITFCPPPSTHPRLY